jgi:Multidrug resistance efflux pump
MRIGNSKSIAALSALVILVSALASCAKNGAESGQGQGAQQGQGSSARSASGPGGNGGQGSTGSQGGQGFSGGAGGGRRAAVVSVQAQTAIQGQLVADRDTAGVVSPSVQSQVAAQVAGTVLKVNRLAGDWVKAGDVIVQLDDSQLRLTEANAEASLENAKINLATNQDNTSQANPKLALQVKSAQAAYDSAKKYYDSQKALFDLGGISASQLDTASSQLATAQANLEGAKTALDQNAKADVQTLAQLKLSVTQAENQLSQARLNLQYAGIRAPFDGQIAAINVQPGMYVSLNTAVLSLVSGEKIIQFNIAPGDAPAIRVGLSLAFEYGGKSYPIRVRQEPSAPINGVVPIVASPVSSLSFPFGTVGNVSYQISVASGILLPLSSLGTLENKNFVYTIVDGKVAKKDVTVIGEAGITAAVVGLVVGDVVVVSPPPGLIAGVQVQTIMLPGSGSGAPGPGNGQASGRQQAAGQGMPGQGQGAGQGPSSGRQGQTAGSQGQWSGSSRQGQAGGTQGQGQAAGSSWRGTRQGQGAGAQQGASSSSPSGTGTP